MSCGIIGDRFQAEIDRDHIPMPDTKWYMIDALSKQNLLTLETVNDNLKKKKFQEMKFAETPLTLFVEIRSGF